MIINFFFYRIFSYSQKNDIWDNLSENQKNEILQGIKEIEYGETIDYDEFIEKHR
jgi:hypothetical protein